MRVLVCGDRNWTDRVRMSKVLSALRPTVIIEGEARGADRMAAQWAGKYIGSERINRFPAHWSEYGRAAGPIRNQQMLDEGQPDLVVAFHDHFSESKGTSDMVHRANKIGIPVLQVGPGRSWLVWGNRELPSTQAAISAAHFSLSPEQ